jgi:thioesterase domain-containing protein
MLVPVQTGGNRTPLIVMHGMFGVLPWRGCKALAEYLGPDQPLYGIQAPGFDGTRKPCAKVPDAANEYLREIRRAGLKAPFVIAGVCGGGIMALQVAQALAVVAQYAGDPAPVPLLTLIDPPGLPGYELESEELNEETAALLRDRVSSWFLNARERLEEVPFDIGDAHQLAIATDVGAAIEWSISTYYPTPYSGRVEVLAIEPLAQLVNRPHWPWRKVLVGPWKLSTLPCQHHEIFTTYAAEAFKWLKERLDGVRSPAPLDERPPANP